MRTTITLDPDVELLLKQAARERGVSFKQALNDSVRAGVLGANRRRRLIQRCFPMGAKQCFCWNKALTEAERMEDEGLSRKLTLGN